MFKKGWAKLGNLVLDPSIVFSFDKFGYYRHRAFFEKDDLNQDMTGRVCLITGARFWTWLRNSHGTRSTSCHRLASMS